MPSGIDGANNSLEDISLIGSSSSTDGILIGANNVANNNILFNIRGSGFPKLIYVSRTNIVNNVQTVNCPGQANDGSGLAYTVCDLTIMGVTNASGNTIQDDVSGTTLSDTNLGMYILGEPVQSGSASNAPNHDFLGYSHFTTSPNWPSWVVGSGQPPTACPSTGLGSLYSVTGTSTPTLFECEGSGWVTVK